MTAQPFVYRHSDGRIFRCRSRLALITLVTDALGVHAPKNLGEVIDKHTSDPAITPPPKQGENPMPPPVEKLPPAVAHQGLGQWREIDSLKLLQGVYHYNASIVRHNSRLYFAYRRQQSTGFSDICGCCLDNDFNPDPRSHFILRPPRLRDDEHHEDPRLWVWKDKLCVSWTNWFGSWKDRQPQVRAAVLNKKFEVEQSFVPNYRGNDGSNCQKNWVFFTFGDRLHFSYYAKPHMVVELSPNGEIWTEHINDWPSKWSGSDIRGGTPAVERDGEFWTFFHSHDPSLPCAYNPGLRRYNVGAMAFENKPPFRVTRYTPKPLWIASERDRHLHWAPLCIFPSGLVVDDQDWLISFGMNDLYSAICRVPHKQILERTIAV